MWSTCLTDSVLTLLLTTTWAFPGVSSIVLEHCTVLPPPHCAVHLQAASICWWSLLPHLDGHACAVVALREQDALAAQAVVSGRKLQLW